MYAYSIIQIYCMYYILPRYGNFADRKMNQEQAIFFASICVHILVCFTVQYFLCGKNPPSLVSAKHSSEYIHKFRIGQNVYFKTENCYMKPVIYKTENKDYSLFVQNPISFFKPLCLMFL